MISWIVIGIACLVALMAAAWGFFMLLSSPDRLINSVKRLPFGSILPFPEEGTALRKLLIGFYRFLGVLGLSVSVFIIVMLIIHLTRGR
jgi:hypothetical protein